jgi:hypothetical protein
MAFPTQPWWDRFMSRQISVNAEDGTAVFSLGINGNGSGPSEIFRLNE